MLLVLAIAAVPTWLSVEHFRTFVILEDHGVRTSAEVFALEGGGRQGPRTMAISPDDNPSVLTRVSHWPRGTEVGDALEVVYDPANPGRVVATDAPVVDAWIAVVALLEIGALWLVSVVVPPTLALLVRRVRDPAWRPRAAPEVSSGRVGRRPWSRSLSWGPAVWRGVGRAAREQGVWKALMIFAFLPITFAVLGVGITAAEVRDLIALDERGVTARAEVLSSEWAGNRQERLTVWVAAQEAEISRWAGAPRYGDPIDVIHLPEDPQVVRQVGVFPWGHGEVLFAVLGVVGVITTPFVTPAAIAGLLGRPAETRGRRTGHSPPGRSPQPW
ncbi:hypothetical protein EDD34_2318 [Myceligenerans xiligouense]|uniref:DUF3592 domain-containing protein n=2 Tax=Myceligenerans xiligouense TaxID=253184 RepID=A0A3N4YQC2_9MICO|nr:hypothetical protein EDD34_2318 [Myceligenerans xiligouense]